MSKKLEQYIYANFGLLLTAISFNIFISPNNIVPGGIDGLSIITRKIFNVPESIFILLMNIFLIILSYILIGKSGTRKTILGSIYFPIYVSITKFTTYLFNFSNLDIVLQAVLGGILTGIGLGIVYKNGYTSGGTDILNQIFVQEFKIPMSKAFFIIDGTIVLLSAIVFGIPNMLYSIITLYFLSTISNETLLSINKNKVLYIYTNKPKEVKELLCNGYHYDLTIFDTIGGFTKKKKKLYMCSVSTNDYYLIKDEILYIDNDAFLVVTTAYEQKNANVLLRNDKKVNTRMSKVLKRTC